MATFTKIPLSGSTNGKGIKITQTASAGNTIHTAVTGITDLDEVWIYAVNTDGTARAITIQWGGTTAPDDSITASIDAESGLLLLVPGLILQNGLIIKAFAAVANKLVVFGFVNRITA
jgi:hypothetical protein